MLDLETLQRAPRTENTHLVTEIENHECVNEHEGVLLLRIVFYDLVSCALGKPCSNYILQVVHHSQVDHEEPSALVPDGLE